MEHATLGGVRDDDVGSVRSLRAASKADAGDVVAVDLKRVPAEGAPFAPALKPMM
jgi:hypothetical protein